MADPELVMLDEPMAGVNPALKQSLLGHVKSLRDEGRTVLFVEHDMDMVRDISDWVIVMAQGKVIAEGPPDSVMGDQRVIDAYLGSHHDQDLSEEMEEQILAEAQAEIEDEPARRASRPSPTDRRESTVAEPQSDRPSDRDRHRRAHARTSQAAEGAVLRADDLIAGYLPGVNILNGADLYCQENELVGIIGPNGAGKSTLLKALFGLVHDRHREGHPQGRRHHQPARRRPGDPGHRLRAPDQQRLPVADHPGEPRDGRLPDARRRSGSGSSSSATSSPRCATGGPSVPGRCPAGSGRWSPWAAP